MKHSLGAQPSIFPNPAVIACTYDKQGKPNGATLAWVGIASSDPPAIAIAVRPTRHTYGSLIDRKAFTVNLPPAKYVKETDFFGMASGQHVDKFEKTGLTPVRAEFVDAPYIEEFPVNIECVVTATLDLGAHALFIGEVKDIKVDESFKDNLSSLYEDAGIITFDNMARAYRTPGEEIAKAFSVGLELR